MRCFICGSQKLTKFLDLGHQPPSDAFIQAVDLDKPEISYPLSLYFCGSCFLVQLSYAVDPKVLFSDYVYTSGMNNSLKANFEELVYKVVRRFQLGSNDFAIDIGSNDGTLLANYRSYGVRALGIDPSSATSIAIKNGIPTVIDFFNEKVAARVNKKYGQAKIITATNVFAHVPNLTTFIRGIKKLLTSDGVFISESGYLLDLIKKNQYDSIYHEHLRYYSVLSLITLFKKSGLEIFDVERIGTHNGSIRVFAGRLGAHPKTKVFNDLVRLEKQCGLDRLKTMRQFAKRALEHRRSFQSMLSALKNKGKSVVGIGAPAKGNTLLNSCHIGPDTINYLAEKSKLKIGLYSPGVHIPVVAEKKLFKDQPDYAVILSWNIADELMHKLKYQGFKGKFIIPFPEPIIKY